MALKAPATIAVVGGGITGLAAAYELLHTAGDRVDVQLFEASDQLGGKLQTEKRKGFTLELGPDAFLSTKPSALQLCRELGLADELIGTNPDQRNVYILHGGQLEPLPDGLIMMAPTSVRGLLETPLLSWRGKLRTALEPLIPTSSGRSEESLRGFISRRFGPQLYERVLEPLMSGIYAGDGSRLSVQATFPMLPAFERRHGSVALGARMLGAQRQHLASAGAHVPRSLFLAPKNGFQSLVQALADRLEGAEVHLESPIRSILRDGQGYRIRTASGRTHTASAVVMATPAFAAASALSALDADLAAALQSIEYASTVTVNLAYRERDLSRQLDGYGYLVPQAEGRPALACTWTSTKFSHRAPSDKALLRVFFGRAGEGNWTEKSDSELLEEAYSELSITVGPVNDPLIHRIQRWPRSMPQYNVGHLERVAKIEAVAHEHPGLELAGAAYHGVGIPNCISSGRGAARAVLQGLAVPETIKQTAG